LVAALFGLGRTGTTECDRISVQGKPSVQATAACGYYKVDPRQISRALSELVVLCRRLDPPRSPSKSVTVHGTTRSEVKARKTIGHCRVSTEGQADRGVSLDTEAEKIRAMATVHDAELIDVIVDGGESGKSLQRRGVERLLTMVDRNEIQSSSSRSRIDSRGASGISGSCWSGSKGAKWPLSA